MSDLSVHELRKQGYNVRIQHCRETKYIYFLEDGTVCSTMTRGEYEKVREEYLFTDCPFSSALLPRGGFTRVEVTSPLGHTVSAKHNFGKRNYDKKLGVKVCLGKILKNFA